MPGSAFRLPPQAACPPSPDSDRHPERDFFIADLIEVTARDDLPSMEHPLFALKAGDKRVRTYDRKGVRVTVKPGYDGCATIHDKDVWIYAVSQMVAAMNLGRAVSRTIRFTAYDFLMSTHRRTDGDSYKRLGDALARLSGTRIETNIETGGQRERRGFGLLDSFRIVERDHDQRMVAIEVTLPDWLYRSVQAHRVLMLSPEYFRLRKPLDRRVYELVRKHCGSQSRWRISVVALHEKSGSTAALKKFRLNLKELSEHNHLPDYRIHFDAVRDTATFYRRSVGGSKAQLRDVLGSLK